MDKQESEAIFDPQDPPGALPSELNEEETESLLTPAPPSFLTQPFAPPTLHRYIPIIPILQNYNVKAQLPADIIAGFSVAIMVIPQSLSYAHLARLPPELGLYSSITPSLVYAVLGGCQNLAVGPVAVVSLLLGQSLSVISEGSGPAGKFSPRVHVAVLVTCGVPGVGNGLNCC